METRYLTDHNVVIVYISSCYKDKQVDRSNAIKVEGFMINACFDPVRLETQRDLVDLMFDEVPEELKVKSSWSQLLDLPADKVGRNKYGEYWTDLYIRADHLYQIGVAFGKIDVNK